MTKPITNLHVPETDITHHIEAIEYELFAWDDTKGGSNLTAKEATAAWRQLQALTRKVHGVMMDAQANDPAYD